MPEILITGGAGSLGRRLAERLREEGWGVRVLDLPGRDFSPFEGWARIHSADILDRDRLQEAVDGVAWVYHLAAVLPPISEEDPHETRRVNVEGTRLLLEVCRGQEAPPRVALASSVSVYGDTSSHEGLVGPDHPVSPTDHYAHSKVMAEGLVRGSGLPHVILRISAVAVAAFLDPPDPWPFQPHQRIELIALEDLVSALGRLPKKEEALGTTLLLAGGSTWQVTGLEYVRRWGEVMEVPLKEMNFQERPGWLHWYDTRRSQDLLAYQQTTLESFLIRLREAVEEALA